MRPLGLIAGMSPASTPLYYDVINARVGEVLGGGASAPLWIHSVDWGLVQALQAADDWPAMDALLANAARGLVAAGAQGLVLCTNTMHRCAPAITAAAPGVPFLHIVDVLADALAAAGRTRAGLLGTRFTMEGDLYPGGWASAVSRCWCRTGPTATTCTGSSTTS